MNQNSIEDLGVSKTGSIFLLIERFPSPNIGTWCTRDFADFQVLVLAPAPLQRGGRANSFWIACCVGSLGCPLSPLAIGTNGVETGPFRRGTEEQLEVSPFVGRTDGLTANPPLGKLELMLSDLPFMPGQSDDQI